MPPPPHMELGKGRDKLRIPILYEDRSVLAIDKPAGWLLVPYSWQRTPRNLQVAINQSIAAGAFWAKARNLKFLRPVHRLDGETSGILLLSKSLGGVDSYGQLFETRQMTKVYLAVVRGVPAQASWVCQAKLTRDSDEIGRMRIDPNEGKESETSFRLITSSGPYSLIEARPLTGRTHQIRLHLLEAGLPITGDDLYGPETSSRKTPLKYRGRFTLGLRAVHLSYFDPFLKKPTRIDASSREFLEHFGLNGAYEASG